MNNQNPSGNSSSAIIVMGVSGCGKSTVGMLLAEKINATFHDGDHFHPQANIDKMASGQPLDDNDRQGWLETLRDLINTDTAEGKTPIIACSALKKKYRELLRTAQATVHTIHLTGTKELLQERTQIRAQKENHFMPPTLLDSQLATLEDPTQEPNTHTLNIAATPKELATQAAIKINNL